MPPNVPPADFPSNLSPQAIRDALAILRESQLSWGTETARATAARLFHRCAAIADGTAIGHFRPDIPSRRWLFVNEPPFVIVFTPTRRQVVRILHQARDMPRLLR